MPFSRQDRINLHKNPTGVSAGEATTDNIPLNSPQTRLIIDDETGEEKVVQYIKTDKGVKKLEYSDVASLGEAGIARWHISKEYNIDTTGSGGIGTGTFTVLKIPANTYVLDIRILVMSLVTAGSMDVDLGDGQDPDAFVDNWNTSGGQYWIFNPGQSTIVTAGKKTGKYYIDNDTIDITINTCPTIGKIKVMALMMKNPISNSATATE